MQLPTMKLDRNDINVLVQLTMKQLQSNQSRKPQAAGYQNRAYKYAKFLH